MDNKTKELILIGTLAIAGKILWDKLSDSQKALALSVFTHRLGKHLTKAEEKKPSTWADIFSWG